MLHSSDSLFVPSLVCDSDRPREVIDDALSLCSLGRDQFQWADLHLGEDERIVLPEQEQRVEGSLIRLRSADLATLKHWVGSDQVAKRSPHRLPSSRILDPQTVSDVSSLTRQQWLEMEKAARVYLYRDPALVADSIPLLERSYGRSEVAVIALGKVTLPAGSVLELRLFPTILMIEELVLDGGVLSISAASRVHVGTLTKTESRVS